MDFDPDESHWGEGMADPCKLCGRRRDHPIHDRPFGPGPLWPERFEGDQPVALHRTPEGAEWARSRLA